MNRNRANLKWKESDNPFEISYLHVPGALLPLLAKALISLNLKYACS